MSTSEFLAQYGVSFQQARDFIHSNLNSPATIYNTAAQFGITFDMLGELYAEGVTGEIVKSFFAGQGFDISLNAPHIVLSTPNEPDIPELPDDIPTAVVDPDKPDLRLNNVLQLTDEEIANYDWDSLITDYQTALANFDWNAYNTSLTETLADFNWDAWAAELQSYANMLATDDSWITELESFFGSSDFDNLFDDSLWEDAISELDDINWDEYSDYLAQFGITTDQAGDIMTQLFGAIDWEQIVEQIANIDWSAYADMLANIDYDAYTQSLEGFYNTDYTNQLALIGLASNNSQAELLG